jgi:hypothetical protein
MSPAHFSKHQHGAITLLVAIALVLMASLTSFYSARSVLVDQLSSHNHARASQARWAADAALASAQSVLANHSTPTHLGSMVPAVCPPGVMGPQWQCSTLSVAPHPEMPSVQLFATAVRDLVLSPHVITVHASALDATQSSRALVRESVFVPALAPAPAGASQAALVLNGCISQAMGASVQVCPLVGQGTSCSSSAQGPAVQTHFAIDTDGNGHVSASETQACLALGPPNLPGGGALLGPSTATPKMPCTRAAWGSVLGNVGHDQLQAWSAAQARNGLTAQTTPPRSVYWVDSPDDWQHSVGSTDNPVVLVFSAKACAWRCPHIGAHVRIVGSVVFDSGCDDEKMRGWRAGTIDGQLLVESGLPEWQSGLVRAHPQSRKAYRLQWPQGIQADRVQRINGSWSEGTP